MLPFEIQGRGNSRPRAKRKTEKQRDPFWMGHIWRGSGGRDAGLPPLSHPTGEQVLVIGRGALT